VKQAAISGSREEFERDRANLERARDLAVALGDAPRQARALYWLGRLSYVLGAFQQSLDYAGQSLEIADRLGDESLAAPPVNLMGRVYWNWTEFPRAGKMLERSVEQMRGIGNRTEEATAAGAAGFVMGCMGEFERALAYADRGVDLAREIQNPFAEAAALQNRAFVLEHRGRLDASLREYAEARRIAHGIGDRFRVYIIEILEGRAMMLAGDPAGGRALLGSALAFAQQIGTKFFLGWQKTCLAGCLLVEGDAAAARDLAREAMGLAGETGERFIRALAQRTAADAVARLDPSPASLGEVDAAYREVVAVLGEIGARPELARSCAGWAALLRARGDRARADELAERARALFVEMDLGWDLGRLAAAVRGVS